MTANSLCSCDEAKHWKDRAVKAELSLLFANQQLERLLGRINQALRDDENAAAELADPGPLREARGVEGLLGFSDGTAEERQAAIDAAPRSDDAR